MPDPDDNHMLTPALTGRVRAGVTAALHGALAAQPGPVPPARLAALPELVAAFFRLWPDRPVRNNTGGSGFNDSLTLYVLARLIDPALIVESGVHRGHATWVLRRACPQAEVHAFDPDLSGLVHRDPAAHYRARDWAEVPLTAPAGRPALAVFDDHVSHARRIREAHARGFRLLLLDDNFPAEHLYATGVPPVPTLAMVLDPALVRGCEVAWRRRGRPRRYVHEGAAADDADAARALVAAHLRLPDLAPVTRHAPQSNLTLVTTRLVATTAGVGGRP